jgi:two-component sensor histidine kinase
VVKIKQISEVQTNYQIRQKEASIKVLKSQAKLVAQKNGFQRKVALFGLGMLLIIAAILYNGYRNKRRSNFELQFQQIEINKQNAKLQGLIVEKDKILAEKDWLLKEVHHRVKNNLQIVMSLLNTQSAYLKNNAAIEAISDSQNRVHAISLIHHKLYSTSSVSDINMPAYISDLVHYLGDCFDTVPKGIRFEQNIDSFELELSQAIPIGLILNEAITNAIKHAFEQAGGTITIGLKLMDKHQVLLTLSDDGKGLAPDFNINQARTLGMEMMKALSTQLSGDFQVENQHGVCLRILFNLEKTAVN